MSATPQPGTQRDDAHPRAAARSKAKKNATQFLLLLVAVIVVIALSIVFQKWWNNRPGPEPKDLSVTFHAPSGTQTVPPYTVCEVDATDCPEDHKPPVLKVEPGETLSVTVPEEVYDHEWRLLTVYTLGGATDNVYKGREHKVVTIPATLDPIGTTTTDEKKPELVVVEVQSLLVGRNDKGEETPYMTVWSLNTKPDADESGK